MKKVPLKQTFGAQTPAGFIVFHEIYYRVEYTKPLKAHDDFPSCVRHAHKEAVADISDQMYGELEEAFQKCIALADTKLPLSYEHSAEILDCLRDFEHQLARHKKEKFV